MVYDIISDNVVQIGLSILDVTTLDYTFVLKKHISKIKEISIQFSGAPGPAQDVTISDITHEPDVQLCQIAGVNDANVHTHLPTIGTDPDTTCRIIQITTSDNLNNGNNILYLRILLDKAGEV